jgi:hypothetical protein
MVNYGMCCRIAVEEREMGTQEKRRAKGWRRGRCGDGGKPAVGS